MRRVGRLGRVMAGCAAFAAFVLPRAGGAQGGAAGSDTTFVRLERLVSAGDRPGARTLADSLLQTLDEQNPAYAEALYWRAFTAAQAAEAERDYLRLSIEHPLSPRAADALLALAQLEYARGDRAAARRRFERLLSNYPAGRHVARASYWSGRLAMEDGDTAGACRALAQARQAVSADDVELANQISYAAATCALVRPTPDTSSPAPARPAIDRVPTPAPSEAVVPAGPVASPAFSVQVAAFASRAEAVRLEAQLRQRGFDVRVAEVRSGGARVPYRVRIGRYATRAAAVDALRRIRAARLDGIVVEAEPR